MSSPKKKGGKGRRSGLRGRAAEGERGINDLNTLGKRVRSQKSLGDTPTDTGSTSRNALSSMWG